MTELTPDETLAAIARAARRHVTDENLGDTTERIETVLWLATDGAEGRDWGAAYEDDDA